MSICLFYFIEVNVINFLVCENVRAEVILAYRAMPFKKKIKNKKFRNVRFW